MFGGELNYVCFRCQLIDMDMFALPILTICKPFEIRKSKSKCEVKDEKSLKEFTITDDVTNFFNGL